MNPNSNVLFKSKFKFSNIPKRFALVPEEAINCMLGLCHQYSGFASRAIFIFP